MGTTSSYQRWEIWEIWASDGIAVGDLNDFTAVPTRSLQRTQASHAAQQSRAVHRAEVHSRYREVQRRGARAPHI